MQTQKRHPRAFENDRSSPSGKLALAFVPAAGGFTTPRTDAAANPQSLGLFTNAAMRVVNIHGSVTPRSRCTSTGVRNCFNAFNVALTTLMGLVEP